MRLVVHLLGNCSAPVLIGWFMHLVHSEPPSYSGYSSSNNYTKPSGGTYGSLRRGDDDGNMGGGILIIPSVNSTTATNDSFWECDAGCAHRTAFRLLLACGIIPVLLVSYACWIEVQRRDAEAKAQELADIQADTRRAARHSPNTTSSAAPWLLPLPAHAARNTSMRSGASITPPLPAF